MAITWTAIEDAIYTAIVAASGLASDKVFWSRQGNTHPEAPYIVMKIDGPSRVGVADEETYETDLGRPAGQEVEIKAAGLREFTLELQAFYGGATGDVTGRALLADIQSKLYLPSIRSPLHAACLAPFDVGDITDLDHIIKAEFQARAVMEIRFYFTQTVSEFDAYIDNVEIEDGTTGDTFVVSSS